MIYTTAQLAKVINDANNKLDDPAYRALQNALLNMRLRIGEVHFAPSAPFYGEDICHFEQVKPYSIVH